MTHAATDLRPLAPTTVLAALAACLVAGLAGSASAQGPYLERLDQAPDGSPTDASSANASISADGSTVLFQSGASNLGALPAFAGLPGTSFGGLLAKDTSTGALEVVNLSSIGQVMPVFGTSVDSVLSGDGRFVAFSTKSDDASLGDNNGKSDVYLRDRQLQTTELISATVGGGSVTAFADQRRPTISADGRYVAFLASGDGLSATPLLGSLFGRHAYLRDRSTATTVRLSTSLPQPGDEEVLDVVLAGDGSTAVLLVQVGWFPQQYELRSYDVATGASTVLLTASHYASVAFGGLTIDRAGDRIAFASASSFLPEDTDALSDVYTLELATGAYTLASKPTLGAAPDEHASGPSLSPDGRYVAFTAWGSGWVPGDAGDSQQAYLHDLETGLTTLLSINDQAEPGASSLQAEARVDSSSALSDHAGAAVFASNYLNLAPPNAPAPGGNYHFGVYLRELGYDGPTLGVSSLAAGTTATLAVDGATPAGLVLLGLSITGQGPLPTLWGLADLAPPVIVLALTADATGRAQVSLPVSSVATGIPLFAKGIDVFAWASTGTFFGVIQ